MRHLITVTFVILTSFKCFASHQPEFNAHDLNITWQAVQNDYQNKSQSLNAITITNNGKKTFPAAGWKMYFNSARLMVSATVSGNAAISFVNGDLFSLTPTSTFTEIKPGQSERIEFIDEEPVNHHDRWT